MPQRKQESNGNGYILVNTFFVKTNLQNQLQFKYHFKAYKDTLDFQLGGLKTGAIQLLLFNFRRGVNKGVADDWYPG